MPSQKRRRNRKMEKKTRLRAPNFTASDNMLLCNTVAKFKHIIENKKTDGPNLRLKHAAWLQVVKIYNASTPNYSRTLESLQQTYKNLKKRAKKRVSDAKMVIPVDKETLLLNIEEYGISSKEWEKVAENTGTSKQECQEMFAAFRKEVETKNKIFKNNVMGTGGAPLPDIGNNLVIEEVEVSVGPATDEILTIYDCESDPLASQNKPPIKAENVESEPMFNSQTDIDDMDIEDNCKTPYSKNSSTNDQASLKQKPHNLLTRKRKLELETPSKQKVSEKITNQMKLDIFQQELLRTQLEDEKEKVEHNRRLRAMEMEDMKKKYEHNEIIRKLELEMYNKT